MDPPVGILRRLFVYRFEAEGLDVEGFGASLLQHEIDHLDGILTLNRADAAERRRAVTALLAVAAPAAAA